MTLAAADSLNSRFLSLYLSSNYIGAILKVISIAIKGREKRLAKWINSHEPAPFNDPQPPNYRGSPVITVSISAIRAIPGTVRIENCIK